MARGPWLMPQGSWLKAHGQGRCGAGPLCPGPSTKFSLAMSHEPWGMSQEPWAINNLLINDFPIPKFPKINFSNIRRSTSHNFQNLKISKSWNTEFPKLSVFEISHFVKWTWISCIFESNLVYPKSRIMGLEVMDISPKYKMPNN